MMQTIAAVVLTYNEEKYIASCLKSLTWCDEIWILDSFSTDSTIDICKKYTNHIEQHVFENFAKQRNWALDKLHISTEWILFVDADEVIPVELAREISQCLVSNTKQYVGYFIPGRQYFWGQHLRFGTAAPNYNLKLFRNHTGHYSEDKIVHECLVLAGEIGFIKQARHMIAKDSLHEYVDRVNWYSNLEAVQMFSTGVEMFSPHYQSHSKVNQVLKGVFKYLPFKPIAMFIYVYLLRQGFRDGYRGLLYAVMESFYVFASYAKLWELRKGLISKEEMMRRS